MARLPPEAYDFYVGLGVGRSYQSVADRYGVTKRAVTKRAAAENWQERLETTEREARARAEQRTIESIEEMRVRHLKTLRAVQAKALQALQSMPLDNAYQATQSLLKAIAQERLVRGEPTDRTAVSVEEVIKREYDRWLVEESHAGNGKS